MSSICLKIGAIKTKEGMNKAFIHNNPEQAERLLGTAENRVGKRFSQCVTQTIKQLRESKELDRKRSAKEIELAEIVFSASPEWFRDKSKLPQNWRNLDDKEKNELWKIHKPLPEKIEQFKKTALKMLKAEFDERALLNVTLHTHETTPHIHALLIPITKPEPNKLARLSYEKIFGQAKGKKEKDGFEVWQDKAGQWFEPIGLSRGMRGSTSEYKPPKQWNRETQEAKQEARKDAQTMQKLLREKALIDKYGNRLFIVGSIEENRKIAMAKKLMNSGKTSEGLERQILEMHRKTATRMHTERNANRHLRLEKQKATRENSKRKTNEDFEKMFAKAKQTNPAKAEQALQTLLKLSTPAEQSKLIASPGRDLNQRTPQIQTQLEPPRPAEQKTPTASFDEVGEAEPMLPKKWEEMTAGEKMSYLKAKKAWEERENQRRERMAKKRFTP